MRWTYLDPPKTRNICLLFGFNGKKKFVGGAKMSFTTKAWCWFGLGCQPNLPLLHRLGWGWLSSTIIPTSIVVYLTDWVSSYHMDV